MAEDRRSGWVGRGLRRAAGVWTLALATNAPAAEPLLAPTAAPTFAPIELSLQPEPESVYAPPEPFREEEGFNAGGVNFEFTVAYLTDYVFRGIEIFEPEGGEDRLNLQANGRAVFNLGNFPHPFVGVFVNVAESDPISSFQEIRPFLGVEWTVRPLILSAGHTSYLYPDRDELETNEVFGRIEIDDSYFLKTDRPFLSPYVFAAYDYDRYNGVYLEAGVRHEFEVEGTGLTLTAEGHVAYQNGIALFSLEEDDSSGFQHYQLGLTGSYSLNSILNIPQRYGQWSLNGYLFYTDSIEEDQRADDQLWGGAGITFRY